jgi:phosphoribosylaminoimidazole-succinocarboxamide synthase
MQDGRRILITTDRISAFDSILGLIPYKGELLNQLSAWWFEKTADIVPNHVIAVPDANATVGREANPIPLEIVMRGYITGVTTTSLWYQYETGARTIYGHTLPDGLQKYDALPQPILTPTTKAASGHDERITAEEILDRGIVSAALWFEIERTARALFARGQALAQKAGLILVDTKYEMGLIDGRLHLIDELHTPDSSRYWDASAFAAGQIENYDKEFLRKWYAAHGYRGDGPPPPMPDDFRAQVAARYMTTYERLTGREFAPAERPAGARLRRNLAPFALQADAQG